MARRDPGKRIIIVGGGASGALLACHLLRDPAVNLGVTVIEKSPNIGHGVAYGTANQQHVLNVRASNMSAFADDPDHFVRWLVASHGTSAEASQLCFVPRATYGRYVASLIAPLQSAGGRSGRIEIVRGECVCLQETSRGVVATLADGTDHVGDIAVLATGHDVAPPERAGCHAPPWTAPSDAGIAKDAAVLILGTGLSMVDYVLSLLQADHEGPIVAISRRGLLPRVHRLVEPLDLRPEEIAFGTGAADLLRWFRAQVRRAEEHGGDWRSAVDALRPFAQTIWQRLPLTARRHLLEHARAWWDVHRHRMAPEVDACIMGAIAQGRLTVIAGTVCGTQARGERTEVLFRRRGTVEVESMLVSKIVECKGIVTDPLATGNPLLRSLLDQRLARADPLRIGIDVAETCALIGSSGEPSQRLYAVGPLTRAAFWEIVAIPDIRVQCAKLAKLITSRLACSGARDAAVVS